MSWHDVIAASGLPPGEARVLAAHAAGQTKSWLIAHAEDPAVPAAAQAARDAFARRRAGEPVAYIVGEREFYSLELSVSPAVLIPRPETEFLVDLARERLPRGGSVLDVGTGSGAIAIAIAHSRPDAQVWASDISPAALDLARRNAARHRVCIRFLEGDGPAVATRERFDLIVSNPPYIARSDPHLFQGDLRFEPRVALDGGPDGLDLIRRIATQARAHLHDGAWLMLEHGHDQHGACAEALRGLGYADIAGHRDLAGHLRIVCARWAGERPSLR